MATTRNAGSNGRIGCLDLVRPILIAFALAAPFAPAVGSQEAADEAPPRRLKAPRSRRTIDGMDAVQIHSRIVLGGEPYKLEEVFAFPDRARSSRRLDVEGKSRRLINYQWGEMAFTIGSGTAESIELADEERLDMLRHLALRRAACLWPNEFEWTRTGETMHTDLGELGSLEASVPYSPQPTVITSRRPSGEVHQALTDLVWQRLGDRLWPWKLRLVEGGEPVWEEEVLDVETNRRYLDVFFRPADRMVPQGKQLLGGDEQIRLVSIPSHDWKRFALREDLTWPEALGEARRLGAEQQEELDALGLRLDPYLNFELNGKAAPQAVLLRLETQPELPPEGWNRQLRMRGFSLFYPDLDRVLPRHLQQLQERAEAREKATVGVPYVRVAPKGSGPAAPKAQLVLRFHL